MICELSYLVYGGQPRKILQSSSDVAEDERQSMMKWSGNLKSFGKYDEFISAGGISWIDVPTPTGRRLLARVFATQGESRDSWYFLGLLLSKSDYEAIGDYGKLIEFVESFSLENVLSERSPGSKMTTEFKPSDLTNEMMPPLFSDSTDSEWVNAYWIQSRVKKRYHQSSRPLHIAFNPPKARSEYTTLLLSEGFPMPGIRLKPGPEATISEGGTGEKKKPGRWTRLLLISLLVPAFATGYYLNSSTQQTDSSLQTSVLASGETRQLPTIRLPRKNSSSFTFVLGGVELDASNFEVRSRVQWMKVSPRASTPDGSVVYPCKVDLSSAQGVNEPLVGSLVVVQDGKTINEQLVEIETADIAVSLLHNSEAGEPLRDGESLISGIVFAHHGVVSVTVNSEPAELDLSASGTLGQWKLTLSAQPERAAIVVVDRNGNQFTSTELLKNETSVK